MGTNSANPVAVPNQPGEAINLGTNGRSGETPADLAAAGLSQASADQGGGGGNAD